MQRSRLGEKSRSYTWIRARIFTDFPNGKAHYGAIALPLGVGVSTTKVSAKKIKIINESKKRIQKKLAIGGSYKWIR